ncbi:hypothetical protein OKW21_001588 [Catalinimonas alkaloidigena]|uniref:DUF7003 family protein n=1 Tax=Catalinimonas alkaloidigena TaxID=1075417 RepID=UPI0024061820|nr:hypothetical protein [Catalinimonas alkaloidigena]MDF9796325.1 hypothetical protein [Catalinimonas alkaloidigena]
MYDTATILATIAGEFPVGFPDFTNVYCEYAGARLHCFRSEKKWVITTEVICDNFKMADATNEVYYVGNGLKNFLVQGDSFPIIDNIDETFTWIGNKMYLTENIEEIVVKGRAINISELVNSSRNGEKLRLIDVLRFLVDNHREILFLDQRDVKSNIQEELQLILTLEEWYHPQPDEELTELESIRMIAKVLQSGKVEEYFPRIASNTHWSNWTKYFDE